MSPDVTSLPLGFTKKCFTPSISFTLLFLILSCNIESANALRGMLTLLPFAPFASEGIYKDPLSGK